MPYFFLFVFIIFCFSFIQRTDTKLEKVFEINLPFIIILVVTLILFYGLRYDVGIDYMSYYKTQIFVLNEILNSIYLYIFILSQFSLMDLPVVNFQPVLERCYYLHCLPLPLSLSHFHPKI